MSEAGSVPRRLPSTLGTRVRVGVRSRLTSLNALAGPDAVALGTIALFLAAFGAVMVLSASAVEASQATGNPYTDFTKQAAAEVAGVVALAVAAAMRRSFWLRAAPFVFGATVLIQLATALTPLGRDVNGNQNWIVVAGVSVQPSEFLKLGLVLMLGAFFARRPAERLGVGLLPVAFVAIIAIGAVAAGHDLGTCLVIGLMVLGGMFFAGVRKRMLVGMALVATVAFLVLAATRGSRVERLGAWTSGCANDVLGTCWQTTQATWALASGGVFGVGIGNSASKWGWLPEADNDFIAAIIGEETGLLGLGLLIVLFVALTIAFLRVIGHTVDPFTKAATGATLAWLVGQAFANIAVVLGFAPVFGVPLPFISAGGSSMVANLAAVGCIISLARSRATAPAMLPTAAMLAHPAGGRRLAAVPRGGGTS